MGWFGSLCSAVGSAVSSVASSVGRAVSSAASSVGKAASSGLSWAREKVSNAIDWIAEKGEQFIDNVKETYKKIKPYLEKVTPWINKVAKVVGVYFPWAGLALTGVSKVIDQLLKLENSEIAHALEKALRGVIKFSQFIKERFLTPEEIVEAQEYKQILLKTDNLSLDVEEQKSLQLTKMLNSYGLVKTELRDVLEMGVSDFQHYLRLRATQKLLNEADHKLTTAQTLEDINPDDIFLVQVAEQLLSTADLSEADAVKLDEITQKRFGKSLIPFVFEELLLVWVQKYKDLENQFTDFSKTIAKEKVLKTRLEVSKKISPLTSEEETILSDLLVKLPGMETKLKRIDSERRSMKNYLFAAEGFMQILEKDDELLQAEDKDYLIDDSAEIASIIMRVAQNNVAWETLTEDEQNLIIDYANIFEVEGKERAENLAKEIEMEV